MMLLSCSKYFREYSYIWLHSQINSDTGLDVPEYEGRSRWPVHFPTVRRVINPSSLLAAFGKAQNLE